MTLGALLCKELMEDIEIEPSQENLLWMLPRILKALGDGKEVDAVFWMEREYRPRISIFSTLLTANL
jgi:hypothetical protein